jgi:HlyD family secretion protein
VDVPARVSSVIENILVREGDIAHSGQLLLVLSCEDIKITATQAKRDLERAARLVNQGFMSPQTYDQTKTRYADARLRLDWCRVTSPTDGTVLTRYREPGESVAPGAKLFTLADLREVYAYIYVAQPELVNLRVGMNLQAVIPELDMHGLRGTIIKISEEAEFTPKNVQTREERTRLVYGVKINFANPDGLLKPGMTIEVALPD